MQKVKGRPQRWTRKVKLSQIAESERKVGELIEFGDARYYTVVRLDNKHNEAFLLRVGPLE